jgi:hypothetical protein
MNIAATDRRATELLNDLSRRWQKRVDLMRTRPPRESLAQVDLLITEGEDRDRHRQERATMHAPHEGGVLVRPRGGDATPAMRGRKQRWAANREAAEPEPPAPTRRRYRTDWPEDNR